MVRWLESLCDCRHRAACTQAPRRRRLGVRPRLAAGPVFRHGFEEVSYLSLSLRGGWQSHHIVAFESLLFARRRLCGCIANAAAWLVQFLEFGYFAFYLLYPVVGGMFWIWRNARRSPMRSAG